MQISKVKQVITIAISLMIFVIGYHFLRINYLVGELGAVRGSFYFYVLSWEALVFFSAYYILHGKKRELGLKWAIPIALIIPVLAFLATESCWDNAVRNMLFPAIIINICIYALLELGFLILFGNFNAAFIMTVFLGFYMGTVNHYVGDFRGDCFKASDILVVGTAAKVADQYHFAITDGMVRPLALLLWIIVITRFFSFPKIKGIKKHAVMAVCGIAVIACEFMLFYYVPIFDKLGYEIYPFRPEESYAEYGATAGFIMTFQDSRIKTPEGYDTDEVTQLLAAYGDNTDSVQDMPTVIAIMNEAFSDLSVLGDFESDDYMSDWYGISDYAMRGFVYVPVCGGGTANSEFEFLTGLSMAGLNVGVYPYQQYNLENAYNIGHDLNKICGETIAFHPYTASNYNRINVYRNFEFGSYYSKDDMEKKPPVINWGVSDEADYNKLIELYENSSKPSFLFNVTMQNHGWYGAPETLTIDDYVSVGEDYKQFSSLISYLTLVRESSSAFKNLLDHFRGSDEKVIIVMFGDHEPGLMDGSMEAIHENDGSVEASSRIYMTPYMIWANYDLGHGQVEKDMSLNYLAANMYELLGIKTDYTGYLLDLQKQFPIIGVFGYKDAAGTWHSYDEQNDKIDEYFRVEYHELTGK
jgi:hypothetical protein